MNNDELRNKIESELLSAFREKVGKLKMYDINGHAEIVFDVLHKNGLLNDKPLEVYREEIKKETIKILDEMKNE